MTSIAVDGSIDADVHLRDDGSPWPFALAGEDHTVFSDTASGIIAALIPDYPEQGDPDADTDDETNDAALLLRWQAAVTTATDVQSLICADRALEGVFDPASESEDVLTALLSDKTVPVEGFETWDHPTVPLVLVATDYDPYVPDRPAPTGNVVWIDPSDEIAFLNSLSNLGVIDFYVQDSE